MTRPSPCGSCVEPFSKSETTDGGKKGQNMTEEINKETFYPQNYEEQEKNPISPPESQESVKKQKHDFLQSVSTTIPVRSTTPPSSWPRWSSNAPSTLGDYVRHIFLDLCDGRSLVQLQQQFPHQWGLLLGSLRHRTDLKAQILDLSRK